MHCVTNKLNFCWKGIMLFLLRGWLLSNGLGNFIFRFYLIALRAIWIISKILKSLEIWWNGVLNILRHVCVMITQWSAEISKERLPIADREVGKIDQLVWSQILTLDRLLSLETRQNICLKIKISLPWNDHRKTSQLVFQYKFWFLKIKIVTKLLVSAD